MATRVKQPSLLRSKGKIGSDHTLPQRSGFSYFLRAWLLYALFTLVVSPSSFWADVFSGWRYGHTNLLLLPFVQGSIFFYAIVLNSDSIFRAVHEAFVMKRRYIPPIIWCLVIVNVIFIIFTFLAIDSRQQEISSRLLSHSAGTLPCEPASMLPAVADQLWLLLLAICAGAFMNHVIAGLEISHINAYQQGGES